MAARAIGVLLDTSYSMVSQKADVCSRTVNLVIFAYPLPKMKPEWRGLEEVVCANIGACVEY
jgi:hypothetical protein